MLRVALLGERSILALCSPPGSSKLARMANERDVLEWFIYVLTQKYATFSGRARRAEYWSYALVHGVIVLSIYAIGQVGEGMGSTLIAQVGNVLHLLVSLGLALPLLGVTVRRLHDKGYSGWMYLILLVPCAGFALIYFLTQEGQLGRNHYGPDPKTIEPDLLDHLH